MTEPRERLARLTPADLDPDQAALYEAIAGGPRAAGPQHFALKDDAGALNGPFGLMLHAPGLGVPLQELGAAIRYRTSLSDRCREIAILVCAVASGSTFEWYAHERVGRAVGLTDAELADIAEGSFAPGDPVEAAVVAACEVLLAEAVPDDPLYLDLREILGEAALIELSVLVGYYRTLAGMMALFAVSAPAED